MILLRKAHIYDVRSNHHNTVKDVLIEKGVITKIAKQITAPEKAKVVSSSNLCVSPGWLDIGTYNGEPGHEYREDLNSLTAAAAKGGYLGLAPFSTSDPVVDNKGQLHFLKSQSQGGVVKIHPIASISKEGKGKDLSEILDLHAAGAVAFSDGDDASYDHDILIRAMQYLKTCHGLLILPACKANTGQVHEGAVSVKMGMQGIPSYEEVAQVEAGLKAHDYSDGKLLIYNVSSADSLSKISRSANLAKVNVSVSCLNLIYDEGDVSTFDLNLKVSPPLRSKKDKNALLKAVSSGSINIITSNHRPLSKEEKDQPFGLSLPGAATIESAFSALVSFTNLSIGRITHCLSIGPHEAIGLDLPEIKVGSRAYLTLLDPSIKRQQSHAKSKGVNNPFLSHEMTGAVIGQVRDRSIHTNS